MIVITKEALYDLLNKGEANFYYYYIKYDVKVSNENTINNDNIDNDNIDEGFVNITITKSCIIELLQRSFISNSVFQIAIE